MDHPEMELMRRDINILQRDYQRVETELTAIRETAKAVTRVECTVNEILLHMKGDDNDLGLLKRMTDLEKAVITKAHLGWFLGGLASLGGIVFAGLNYILNINGAGHK